MRLCFGCCTYKFSIASEHGIGRIRMKQASRIVLILALLIPVVSSAGLMDFFKSGTSKKLQNDFDFVRLMDVATLSGYIEEYSYVTGKFPFGCEIEYPHYVHIATKQQEQYAKGAPPYQHKRASAKEFIVELQSKLGKDIEIPFDLRKAPVNKPNFYIYMVVDNA